MDYGIYKFSFPYGVHFGNRLLESSNITFCADTLFSGLCIEALKTGEDKLKEWYHAVKAGNLIFSDGFPYTDDEFFLPKPFMKISSDENDSSLKKEYKKMKCIAMSKWNDYLNGNISPKEEHALEKRIGKHDTKTHVAIQGLEEPLPYRIGSYSFYDGSGLYIIYGYEDESAKDLFYELLDGLSFSGLGGKRSSGLGRFDIFNGKLPDPIESALQKKSSRQISLSISLPNDDELDSVMENASYMIEKRSGFVESASYSENYMRKRDLFMFSAGSVFERRFVGDIFDVSSGGAHPVYRYGKPVFIGV